MTYIRNAWYVAGWSGDIVAATPFAITILQEPVVIYRREDRQLVALEDRCVHRLAPLSKGRCEGNNLRCMYHGLLFSPQGQVIEIPGQDTVPAKARVKAYPVTEQHSWVWIWMGDPDKADEALIPPATGLDHPDYILGHGQLDYQAEARLINDNLLDFSHLTYVHADSFQATDTWARQRSNVTTLDRGVRIERWTENEPRRGIDGRQDGWMRYDFLVPGVLLMISASFSVGTAKACDFGEPDMRESIGNHTFTSQAVTPMGAQTARYFFSWGPHRNHGDEKLRDILMGIADQAFNEDKTIIEAQQQVINQTVNPANMPTSADRAITLFNRVVDKLAEEV